MLGYTISRAILSDAVALSRGDRFLTQDFTPYNMTAWGFADCHRDPDGYGFGSTLGRLFLRTLPNDYTADSIYTWFPLMHPEPMEGYLKNLGKLDGYSLARPNYHGPPVTVNNYAEVCQVLRSTDEFVPEYSDRAAEIIMGKGCAGHATALVSADRHTGSLRHLRMALKSRSSSSARLLLHRKLSLRSAPTSTKIRGNSSSKHRSLWLDPKLVLSTSSAMC